MSIETMQQCEQCQGTGQIEGAPCSFCRGRGVVPAGDPANEPARKRERHHGVGSDGLHPEDATKPTLVKDHGGLGAGGKTKPQR